MCVFQRMYSTALALDVSVGERRASVYEWSAANMSRAQQSAASRREATLYYIRREATLYYIRREAALYYIRRAQRI